MQQDQIKPQVDLTVELYLTGDCYPTKVALSKSRFDTLKEAHDYCVQYRVEVIDANPSLAYTKLNATIKQYEPGYQRQKFYVFDPKVRNKRLFLDKEIVECDNGLRKVLGLPVKKLEMKNKD